MKTHCLFIEDDRDFLEPTTILLNQRGIAVVPAPTLQEAEALLAKQTFDFIILDLNLPDGNGLEFLRKAQSQQAIPTIILSADFQNKSKVEALELGAYYYLNKPIHIDELAAVIQRVLRLSRPLTASVDKGWFWSINPSTWEMGVSDHSKTIKLTGKEFAIVNTLAQSLHKIVAREILFTILGKPKPEYSDRSLDVIVSRINKKLATLHSETPIQSVRGKGYVFRQAVRFTE